MRNRINTVYKSFKLASIINMSDKSNEKAVNMEISELNSASDDFLRDVKNSRFDSCLFNDTINIKEDRYRFLSECTDFKKSSKGVIYWMCRDYRVQDNWAMLYAQKLAKTNNVPLFVCFFNKPQKVLYPRKRHHVFLTECLEEINQELNELKIKFYIINDEPNSLIKVIKENDIGAIVCEFYPLRETQKWQNEIKENLPNDVPLIQVDAHNIVPVWIASDKLESAARTIRPKIINNLCKFMDSFPPIVEHPHEGELVFEKDMIITLNEAIESYSNDENAEYKKWANGGTKSGLVMLHDFIKNRLKLYGEHSSDPSKNAVSNLSPWIRFGSISAQRCAIEIKHFESRHKDSVKKFLEELIVRRELTDNFCYYNENYDNIKGAKEWAQQTLKKHTKDKRDYLYTKENFENGETHDRYWNAAQIQLLKEAKIHGYMRMYWAKKILEWTKTPEEALEIALYLNDTYSLDGRDPNGFVGVMWSICGVHDQGWKERSIFGKIRYMNDRGLERKYNIKEYVDRYIQQDIPLKKRKL